MTHSPDSPATPKCDVCNGEGRVAYIQSVGGFSEPSNCYKCKGTGRATQPATPAAVEAAMQQCADIATQYNDCGGDFIAQKIQDAILSLQPAGGESGEAWCQPMDCGKHTPRKFMLYYDDPQMGTVVFEDEADARTAFEHANLTWNCYLFGALPLTSGAAQGKLEPLGFMTADEWPKEIDEHVLIYVVHQNAQYESDKSVREDKWEGWHVGYWTDFNGGGWVWHGMLGTITHVAPLLPPPSSIPSTEGK